MRGEPRVRVRRRKLVKEHVNPFEMRLVVLDLGRLGPSPWGRSGRSGPGSRGTGSRHRADSGARRCRQGRRPGSEAAGVPSAGRLAGRGPGTRPGFGPTVLSPGPGRSSRHPAWLEPPGRSGIREARRGEGRRWLDTAPGGRSRPGHPRPRSAQELPERFIVQGLGLAGRRLVAMQPAGVQRGDQAQGDAANLEIEAEDLILLEIPPLEHEVGSLAHPVDHLNAGVQALEIVGRFQVGALPSPFEVEMVDGSVAEIEREGAFLKPANTISARSEIGTRPTRLR